MNESIVSISKYCFGGYWDCGNANTSTKCLCKNSSFIGKPAFIEGPCTFNKTHKRYMDQPFLRCLTCNYPENAGCC